MLFIINILIYVYNKTRINKLRKDRKLFIFMLHYIYNPEYLHYTKCVSFDRTGVNKKTKFIQC